jgi:hypothetical protein
MRQPLFLFGDDNERIRDDRPLNRRHATSLSVVPGPVSAQQSQIPFATLRSSSGDRLPRPRGPRFDAAKI